MADVRRQSRLTKAVECCLRHERGADKTQLLKSLSCEKCPYGNCGSTCKETLFDDLSRFLRGKDDRQMVEVGFNAYGEDVPICPQCEYQLKVGYAYCPKCGTSIDWDDYDPGDEYYPIDDDVLYDDYSENSKP